jgi:hypothetical protein
LSFFFPNSALFRDLNDTDYGFYYPALASRFAAASLWDDYLVYHYTSQAIDPASADPTLLDPIVGPPPSQEAGDLVEPQQVPSQDIAAPGAGDISITPIESSADEITGDDLLNLYTEISGDNIAFIYLYVMYYDEGSDSFLTADIDYIAADETSNVGGVIYPDWYAEADESGVITIDFDWDPTVYFMSDGVNEEFALFEPEQYGLGSHDTTYRARGVYAFIGGEERDAYMIFDANGRMISIWGYSGGEGTGAPRQITPQIGDTFTILEEWLEYENDPDGEFVDYYGATLTYNGVPFEWVPYYAFPGAYVIGFVVADMDGNITSEFVEVYVTE